MNVQDIVYPTGEFIEWSFGLLEIADNLPNYAFIVLGFGGIAYWVMLQVKYNKEAEAKGTLK